MIDRPDNPPGDPSALRWQQRPNEVDARSVFRYPSNLHDEVLLREAGSALAAGGSAIGEFLLAPLAQIVKTPIMAVLTTTCTTASHT